MAHTFGSLRFSTCGRRRKALPRPRKRVINFKPYEEPDTYRRETPEYKSYDHFADINTELVERPQLDSKYTIAPAYNKGAYQVISRENIKDIGR